MMDSIGSKVTPVADRRIAPVVPAGKVEAARSAAAEAPAVQTVAAQLTSEMAARAPVDAERVARIKKAVQEGRFPFVASTVADRLLALKLQWNPGGNDPA